MPAELARCWSCDHYATADYGEYCDINQPEFPDRCERYSYEPGSDEAEENYKRDCLARYICDMEPDRRREFLERMAKRHPASFLADLKARIISERRKRHDRR